LNCLPNLSGICSVSYHHSCRQYQILYSQAVSRIMWAKFSDNRTPSAILSWFSIVIFLSIRICEALSEWIFLSFGKSTSWRNSHYFQKPLWMSRSGTGWRDWLESPHTKIIIIHKVNPGLFIFVRSRSGTGMLNPRWTSYRMQFVKAKDQYNPC
jgi:hypothetical protein